MDNSQAQSLNIFKRFSFWSPFSFVTISVLLAGIFMLVMPNMQVAFIVGGIALLVFSVAGVVSLIGEQAAGRRNWIISTVAIAVIGVSLLALNEPAYRAQISYAESHNNYSVAVNGLVNLGYKPPFSKTLATAYLNWGISLVNAHNYSAGIQELLYTENNFPTLPQAAQAKNTIPQAMLSYAEYAYAHGDAITAGQQYTSLIENFSSYPAAATALSEGAPAILGEANAYAQKNYYQESYNAYAVLLKYFGKSSEAAQSESLAPQVLLTWAQKLIASQNYGPASQEYQVLAAQFPSTPQGKQAATFLANGVSVTGQLVLASGKPLPAYVNVRLSSQWTAPSSAGGSYQTSGQQYYADTNANGYFKFLDIPPGKYLLEWRSTQGYYNTLLNGTTFSLIITVDPVAPTYLPVITVPSFS